MSLPEYLRHTIYGQKVKRIRDSSQKVPQWVQDSLIYSTRDKASGSMEQGSVETPERDNIKPNQQHNISLEFQQDKDTPQLPSSWVIDDICEHQIITQDGTVSVSSEVSENKEIRFIGNNCIPLSCGVWYYEITLDKQCQSLLPVMFGLSRQVPNQQIGSRGTQGYCWLYFSDDGRIMPDRGSARKYGPKFGPGDTIGCGVNLAAKKVFYTKNGLCLGVAFSRVDASSLFPFLIAHSGAIVHTNFGAQDFMFDIQGYVVTQKQSFYERLDAFPVECREMEQKYIENYLEQMGYNQSLRAMTGRSPTAEGVFIENVRLAVLEHEFDRAKSLLEGLDIPRRILFQLDCQKMATAVRQERVAEALEIGKYLKREYGEYPEFAEPLTKVYATLAYPRSKGGAPWEQELYGERALSELAYKIISRLNHVELPNLVKDALLEVEDSSALLVNVYSDILGL